MEFRERQAIYLQIGDHICENILRGTWKEGYRIPSIREMSVSIEVNPNTVMRTYSYLQDMGIIYNKRGIGYFVADHAQEKVLNRKRADFVSTTLPSLFRTMNLLKISFEELERHYDEHAK